MTVRAERLGASTPTPGEPRRVRYGSRGPHVDVCDRRPETHLALRARCTVRSSSRCARRAVTRRVSVACSRGSDTCAQVADRWWSALLRYRRWSDSPLDRRERPRYRPYLGPTLANGRVRDRRSLPPDRTEVRSILALMEVLARSRCELVENGTDLLQSVALPLDIVSLGEVLRVVVCHRRSSAFLVYEHLLW